MTHKPRALTSQYEVLPTSMLGYTKGHEKEGRALSTASWRANIDSLWPCCFFKQKMIPRGPKTTHVGLNLAVTKFGRENFDPKFINSPEETFWSMNRASFG